MQLAEDLMVPIMTAPFILFDYGQLNHYGLWSIDSFGMLWDNVKSTLFYWQNFLCGTKDEVSLLLHVTCFFNHNNTI